MPRVLRPRAAFVPCRVSTARAASRTERPWQCEPFWAVFSAVQAVALCVVPPRALEHLLLYFVSSHPAPAASAPTRATGPAPSPHCTAPSPHCTAPSPYCNPCPDRRAPARPPGTPATPPHCRAAGASLPRAYCNQLTIPLTSRVHGPLTYTGIDRLHATRHRHIFLSQGE